MDGVTLNLTDAQMDAPQTCETITHGVNTQELVRRTGRTRQRVHQLIPRLGGVKVGHRWLFPADAGQSRARQTP